MAIQAVAQTTTKLLSKAPKGIIGKLFKPLGILFKHKGGITMIFLLILIVRGGYMSVKEKPINPMIMVYEIMPRILTSQVQLDREINLLVKNPEAVIITKKPTGTPWEMLKGWFKIIGDRFFLLFGVISNLWFLYVFYCLIFAFFNKLSDMSKLNNHISTILVFLLLQLWFVSLTLNISLINNEDVFIDTSKMKDLPDVKKAYEIVKQTHPFTGIVSLVTHIPDFVEPFYHFANKWYV